MSNQACIPSGWGFGIWGIAPFAGSLEASPGGPIPDYPPFDIYCVGPCGPMAEFYTYNEVSFAGDGSHFLVDGFTLDQRIISGGVASDGEAEVYVNEAVPQDFTLEFTVLFEKLPNDFNNLVTNHVYFGTSDGAGPCAALFFSKIGIIYTGCAHVDGGGNLVIDTLLQPLPDSQLLVSEGEYWTIRIASSATSGTTYVYITKTSDLLSLGHQLRYILPTIPSSSAAVVPPDRTAIFVRGTAAQPSAISLDSICLATGLIIPNIPPVADPGTDQAMQLCEVLRLDGSKSFDPEGGNLAYKWRLIDAPPSCQYIFTGTDGNTMPLPMPTGFADRFYSDSLAAIDAEDPIAVGDVVVVLGKPRTLVGKGSDMDGFFVRTDGFVLPDDLTGTTFTYLRQRGLNTPTSQKPTFYPDAPGLYKFDLTVFDGGLFSPAETVVISVAESPVARGCTPDLSFIWGYLSDFWKLVEDRERIEVFWQGLAQVAASELLNLWQVDYAKSLRDIQRTFQRRWLHYDLLMQQSETLLELTTVRATYGGVESADIPTGGIGGIQGTTLQLQFSTRAQPTVISFVQANPYTALQLQTIIQAAVAQLDTRIRVRVYPNRAGTASRLRIDAPFPFTVLNTSTVPIFSVGQQNAMPTGTQGIALGVTSYRIERSLEGLDIQPNDLLCVDGAAYRIARIADDPSDPLTYQRLVLVDPLPTVMGKTWSISGIATSKDLDFWTGLCEQDDYVTFEVLRTADQKLVEITSRVLASSQVLSKSLPCDATPVGVYLAQPETYSVFLKSVKRRRYTPIDPLIVDVPYLQEFIVSKDDTQVLRRNVDYFIETFRDQPCIRFVTPVPADENEPDVWQGGAPPDRMWAETSYLDNRPRIEQNFGIPAEFTLDDLDELPGNIDYLSCVRGLWYAYFNGPTVFNLHAGTQILLGLPFAEERGTIVEVREDFSDIQGRILIQDLVDPTITRSYTFPRVLDLETNPATGELYKVGDVVEQFAPLVTGVEVTDYVKDPKWFAGYLNQGVFFEVEKFFKFLVRVEAVAFNLSALLFARTFVLRIKPTYTYPLFVVVLKGPSAEVSVTDQVDYHGKLLLFDGGSFKPHTAGVATMYDDPRAAGGGWRGIFDQDNLSPPTPPTYPTVNYPISWGTDKNFLAPEDVPVGFTVQTYGAPFTPVVDDMPFLRFDLPTINGAGLAFAIGSADHVAATPGTKLGPTQVVTETLTWNTLFLDTRIWEPTTPLNYNVVIKQNGLTVATVPATVYPWDYFTQALTINIPVTAGDEIEVFLVHTSGNIQPTFIRKLMVTLARTVPWTIDGTLPAGTYYSYRQF